MEWPDRHTGVPLNLKDDGRTVYFATTIAQKALGHWDSWLMSRHPHHKKHFLVLCDWLVEHQDSKGGWSLWPHLGLNYPSPYSAMTQGEAISALVRAWSVTGEPAYLLAAEKGLGPMLELVEEGGVLRRTEDGVILEEVPSEGASGILNGWIFALFGVYDLLLAKDNWRAKNVLAASLNTLTSILPRYNAGYWSFYDLGGTLASPFYHRLHIAQLQALERAFPEHADAFRRMREEWARQLQSLSSRARALVVKAYQKLRTPPEVILR